MLTETKLITTQGGMCNECAWQIRNGGKRLLCETQPHDASNKDELN